MYLFPTDTAKILKIISNLKNNKSPVMDEIRSEILKQIAYEIVEPLKFLLNKRLDRVFSKDIKMCYIVKPLFKMEIKMNQGIIEQYYIH